MAIRTGIIEARTLLPGRERKKVAAVLAEKVVPAMQTTLPGQLLPEHYPWCFILPPLRKKGRFYVGALVNSRAAGLSAIYAAVSVQWLQKELASDFHIAFWLARIMTAQQNQDGVVNQGIRLKNGLIYYGLATPRFANGCLMSAIASAIMRICCWPN